MHTQRNSTNRSKSSVLNLGQYLREQIPFRLNVDPFKDLLLLVQFVCIQCRYEAKVDLLSPGLLEYKMQQDMFQ